MLTKRIIPCLDVTNGRVVKGTNFVDLRDAGDPVELAKRYNDEGADELVFLDITATSDNRGVLLDLIERTAETVFIPFTVGGGISSVNVMRDLLNAGADKVSVNSAAVRNPQLIREASEAFGAQCIVTAIDARTCTPSQNLDAFIPQLEAWNLPEKVWLNSSSKWEIFTHGGRKPTGIDALSWAIYMAELGAGELLVTSMDKDGTKSGYDLDLTNAISQAVSVPVIASGGAGTLGHITEALHCCEAALLASLLHFRELSISQIKSACLADGLPIRPC